MEKKFKVKAFQYFLGTGKEQGLLIRKAVELGKDLSWQDAKKLRKENKGSWTV